MHSAVEEHVLLDFEENCLTFRRWVGVNQPAIPRDSLKVTIEKVKTRFDAYEVAL